MSFVFFNEPAAIHGGAKMGSTSGSNLALTCNGILVGKPRVMARVKTTF
jgi:hypothetical protein